MFKGVSLFGSGVPPFLALTNPYSYPFISPNKMSSQPGCIREMDFVPLGLYVVSYLYDTYASHTYDFSNRILRVGGSL